MMKTYESSLPVASVFSVKLKQRSLAENKGEIQNVESLSRQERIQNFHCKELANEGIEKYNRMVNVF